MEEDCNRVSIPSMIDGENMDLNRLVSCWSTVCSTCANLRRVLGYREDVDTMGDKVAFQPSNIELAGLASLQVVLEEKLPERCLGPAFDSAHTSARVPMCPFQRIPACQKCRRRCKMDFYILTCIGFVIDFAVVTVERGAVLPSDKPRPIDVCSAR